jgi:hypothetical protein
MTVFDKCLLLTDFRKNLREGQQMPPHIYIGKEIGWCVSPER